MKRYVISSLRKSFPNVQWFILLWNSLTGLSMLTVCNFFCRNKLLIKNICSIEQKYSTVIKYIRPTHIYIYFFFSWELYYHCKNCNLLYVVILFYLQNPWSPTSQSVRTVFVNIHGKQNISFKEFFLFRNRLLRPFAKSLSSPFTSTVLQSLSVQVNLLIQYCTM